MKKLKSTYEIAMERAKSLDGELTSEEKAFLLQEKVKPLLANFYKAKIGPDQLWQELKAENDPELYIQVQLLLLESIGLQTISEEIKRRKEGMLAVENLKGGKRTSIIEQVVEQVMVLQERYRSRRKEYKELYEEALENAKMNMKPVKTKDGRIVMQLQKSLDQDTEERLENSLKELENQSKQHLNNLLDDLKKTLLS